MIVAPEWSILRGIARGLDSSEPVHQQEALAHIFKTVTDVLPEVEAMRVFTLDGTTALVMGATDLPRTTPRPLTQIPNSDIPLNEQRSHWDAERNHWLGPLVDDSQVFGLVELIVAEVDDEWMIWLDLLAGQIADALSLSQYRGKVTLDASEEKRLTDRLTAASRMLLNANDYEDVAAAIIYTAQPNVQAALVTLFDQPLDTNETGIEGIANNLCQSVALATREAVARLSPLTATSDMPELSYINQLRQEIPVLVDNVETNTGFLTGFVREQIIQQGSRQIIAFAMTANERMVGLIHLMYARPEPTSQAELDIYSTLANQIGGVILSKRLLEESLQAQTFASQLVKTNKSIAEADTYEEMGQAILKDMPDSVRAVAISLFNRPFTMMGTPINLKTEAIVTRSRVIPSAFVDEFSAVEDARVTYFLQQYSVGHMMLLWTAERSRRPVMAQTLVDRLIDEGVTVVTSFGLNVNSGLRGIVAFAGVEDLREPGPQYDGLRAIADQLAAIIENRILLQQTSDALDLLRSQYDVTSRVFRSTDLPLILKAVFDFARGAFQKAELVARGNDGHMRRLAKIDGAELKATNEPVSLGDYPAYETLTALEALEVRDVAEDVFITAEERDQLLSQGVRSLILLPILLDYELYGVVMLTSSQPARVLPERVRAMRSLTDQVGVVLQNRNLLETTEQNLTETRILYEAESAMLRTQNNLDVLRVLREFIAPDAHAACLIRAVYDERQDNFLRQLVLEYEITPEAERLVDQVLTQDDDTLAGVRKFLNQQQESVIFSPTGVAIPSNPVNLVIDRYTVESFAALLIRERGRIVGVAFLMFDFPKPFGEGTRRLYAALADQVSIAIENQTLLHQTQQTAAKLAEQVHALQTISELAVEINTLQTDETKLLKDSARALVEALNVDHCGVVLFNEDYQTGVVVAEFPDDGRVGFTVETVDNPLLAAGYKMGTAVVINDLATDPIVTENLRQVFMGYGIASMVIAPLVGQAGELIGSIGLDVYGAMRHFEETEISTVQTIAAQIAVGLQNVRLLRNAQQRAQQLQRISDFGRIAQSTLNLDDLLESALANVPRMLPVAHMTIAITEDASPVLRLAGGWDEAKQFRVPLEPGGVVPTEQTTTGYVYQTGEYLYIPDTRLSPQAHYPHSDLVRSLLVMPLRTLGRTLGVISIGHYAENIYTDTDIAVFQQLVNQLAVAMDNARTYTQSQRVAQNKTVANDIAVKLQQQTEIDKMVELAMNEIGRAIGAKKGRIRLNTNRPTGTEPAETDV